MNFYCAWNGTQFLISAVHDSYLWSHLFSDIFLFAVCVSPNWNHVFITCSKVKTFEIVHNAEIPGTEFKENCEEGNSLMFAITVHIFLILFSYHMFYWFHMIFSCVSVRIKCLDKVTLFPKGYIGNIYLRVLLIMWGDT